jgi:hypothetical protein
MGGGLVYLRFKFQPKEKISPNPCSAIFDLSKTRVEQEATS